MSKKLLSIDIRFQNRRQIEARIHERLVASVSLEDPPECSVWVQLVQNGSNNLEDTELWTLSMKWPSMKGNDTQARF
jgi:hypothetical protein